MSARASEVFALLLLGALLATNAYRAAVQSITHDEALTYLWFANAGWGTVFGSYNANHHVLHTILVKLSTDLFGPSELAVRLPSLAGGAVYFAAVLGLARALVGRGPWLAALVALLTLNPYVLDFLSMARGYGMALGFLFWALLEAAHAVCDGPEALRGRLLRASLALGLAVAANVTSLFPAVALGVVTIVLLGADARRTALAWFLLPGPLILGLIAGAPLSHARPEHFYVGHPRLGAMVSDLAAFSLRHDPAPDLPRYARTETFDRIVRLIEFALLPALVLGIAGILAAVLARAALGGGLAAIARARRGALVVWGTFLVTVGALWAAHTLLGLAYPVARTALYLLPLASMSALLLARAAVGSERRAVRAAGRTVLAGLVVLTLHFTLEFNTDHYAHHVTDARTWEIFALLRERHAHEGPEAVRIRGCWLYGPAMNFYRLREGAGWLARVPSEERAEWSTPSPDQRDDHGGHTYYIVTDHHRCRAVDLPLVPVYTDARSRTTLARVAQR